MITSVEGKRDQKDIREFIDTLLIARDARALRQYYASISPDLNMKYIPTDENYTGEGIDIPININFLWPDIGL
jgi:5S rRNA maturation endonuclease (ribonuclease M5)